jgi:fructose transport system ATP-binding protein
MSSIEKKVILSTEGLTKHYGGVRALESANFSLKDGEHVAIVGDNGAGKSTFIRQVTGVEIPTSGKIYFDGELVNFKTPADAKEAGIETVYQNLALADDLDVPSNIFLGQEEIYFNLGPFSFLNEKKMYEKSLEVLAKTGVKIPNLKIAMSNMSGGQRQCVAVSRSAGFASKLVILDEPTAALGVQETAQVENIIKNLKKQGIPLIVISHNLRQVFDLVDKIWVFRQGKIVGSVKTSKSSTNEIVSLITGVKQEVDQEASYI